jgi:hypothetical protein
VRIEGCLIYTSDREGNVMQGGEGSFSV